MLSVVLTGADSFTYSNPIVKRANLYYKKKEYKKSLKYFLKAGDEVKEQEAANFNIASAYYKMNDFENALKHFGQAFSGSDDEFNARVLFNMGNCYFRQGELKEAYERYKSALKLQPDNRDAKYNLEFALSMLEENRQKKSGKTKKNKRDANKRFGSLNEKNNAGGSDGRQKNQIDNEDFKDNTNFNDDFDTRDDLEDISKEAAMRILNTMTEQVVVRVPTRKEHLTKKGEENEKDW
jgi:tetratricopeptide (TPR) repeat protein